MTVEKRLEDEAPTFLPCEGRPCRQWRTAVEVLEGGAAASAAARPPIVHHSGLGAPFLTSPGCPALGDLSMKKIGDQTVKGIGMNDS